MGILFYLTCGGNVECEMIVAVYAGNEEVGLRNKVHAVEQIALFLFDIGCKGTTFSANLMQFGR